MTHVDLPPDLPGGDVSAADLSAVDLGAAGTVFRNRSFLGLWSAQLLSQLASNLVLAVAFSAIAGVLVERSDARLIMLASNLLRAGGIVLFLLVGENVALLLIINLFVATVTAFFAPAEL